jgi:hypothetical protein
VLRGEHGEVEHGREQKDYGRMYRSAAAALAAEVPRSADACARAFVLLRDHGKEICKTGEPHCFRCPVLDLCGYPRKNMLETSQRKSRVTRSNSNHLGCPIFGAVLSRLIGVPASFAGEVSLGGNRAQHDPSLGSGEYRVVAAAKMTYLSDDRTIAKMGHPIVVRSNVAAPPGQSHCVAQFIDLMVLRPCVIDLLFDKP